VDPRQEQFLTAYLDPKSETYSNAYASALKVGYSEVYAKSILSQGTEWVTEAHVHRKSMLKNAERRLAEFINHDDPKIAQDTSKFVAKTLGKEFYSERTEHTGKDGKSITVSVIAFDEYNDTPQLKDSERA
jgi:phage terminase small subunit